MSHAHVTLNGRTYMPTVYSASITAKIGVGFRNESNRADIIEWVAELYRVNTRTAFHIARSIALRPAKLDREEAVRQEMARREACREHGCCN